MRTRSTYQRFQAINSRLAQIASESQHPCTHRRIATLKYGLVLIVDEEMEGMNTASSAFDDFIQRLTRPVMGVKETLPQA